MRWSYRAKWKRFTSWAQQRGAFPKNVGTPLLLDYLLSLKASGLTLNSIKVHVAAIGALHPPVFITSDKPNLPLTTRVWKGLLQTYPAIHPIAPQRDLNLVVWVFEEITI